MNFKKITFLSLLLFPIISFAGFEEIHGQLICISYEGLRNEINDFKREVEGKLHLSQTVALFQASMSKDDIMKKLPCNRTYTILHYYNDIRDYQATAEQIVTFLKNERAFPTFTINMEETVENLMTLDAAIWKLFFEELCELNERKMNGI